VLVDHDIIPSQARNLETATGVEAMDRTAVILEMLRRRKATAATTSLELDRDPLGSPNPQ
jgi:GTP-binding protein HflX